MYDRFADAMEAASEARAQAFCEGQDKAAQDKAAQKAGDAVLMEVSPRDVIRFVGFGAPEEALARQRQERIERIERVKRIKNKKARQATVRANAVLAGLGLSKRERRELGRFQRKAKTKRPQNYRWDPTRTVESLETEP